MSEFQERRDWYLNYLSPGWHSLQQRQHSQLRILAVGEVCEALLDSLSQDGFEVVRETSTRQAEKELSGSFVNLLIIPHALVQDNPTLLHLAQRAKTKVVITSYPLEGGQPFTSISNDCISNTGITTDHSYWRVRFLLDEEICELLFDVLLRDLSVLALQSGVPPSALAQLPSAMSRWRRHLGKSPSCAIVDSNRERAEWRRDVLKQVGMTSTIVRANEIPTLLTSAAPPLLLCFYVSGPADVEALAAANRDKPEQPLFVISPTFDQGLLKAAYLAGAEEFCHFSKEQGLCANRIIRSIARVRRHRLYLEMAAFFQDCALEKFPRLDSQLIFSKRRRASLR